MISLGFLLLCFLSLVALFALQFPECSTALSGSCLLFREDCSLRKPASSLGIVPKTQSRERRPLKWISLKEFVLLLQQNPRDFIVIDLGTEASLFTFPVPDVFVLTVAPSELLEMLERLPSDRSVVFYGRFAFGIARIQMSSPIEGSAPLYFLKDSLDRLEVA